MLLGEWVEKYPTIHGEIRLSVSMGWILSSIEIGSANNVCSVCRLISGLISVVEIRGPKLSSLEIHYN